MAPTIRRFGADRPAGATRAVCMAALLWSLPAAASALPARVAQAGHAPKPHSTGTMCAAPPAATPSGTSIPPAGDDELPWCVNGSDPRCAPLHHDSAPLHVEGRPAATADANALPCLLPDGSAQKHRPQLGLSPRSGVSERLERPPRAIRRPA